MKPFFTYYGGKWRSAGKYPAPRYDAIIEPFAGSAGYSVRFNARNVTLFDLSPEVVGTWRYLISVSADEIRSLPDLEPDQSVTDLQVGDEARYLIGWWLNKGAASPCKRPSAWMRSGIRPASFWGPTIRERIASQVEGIRHWSVKEASYEEAPDIPATWFIDPPYANMGRHYSKCLTDYGTLGEWCQTRRGQAIVCEAAGATWLPFEPLFTAKSTSGKQKASASFTEVVWTS